ncbi:hypothetical protein AVEN_189334-1 [Araneus ventricosus]|uniref:Uncharacterized protein n=1 Tax=Araneus ventricosus TaxID=182803 RepID=A0A4Y2LUB0_ARAVE|nr:hypothetical protein AVEN_189334-1 [Araneus ventricosus]
MVEQWLENQTVGLMWNYYGERHRTTNALEGWHSKINKAFGKNHPNIFEVILRLKEDAAYYDLVRAKAELNIPPQKRLKSYYSADVAIRKFG